uniref:Uncharacterized protein n=1 Tax=Anguilla anguilla TaxID=7936 RepID=A0A0E9UYN9_ANGAN
MLQCCVMWKCSRSYTRTIF